jgi:UDP-2,3-diacylglucosamine hydrolase
MALHYISDLHIRNSSEPKARAFIAYLDNEIKAGDLLILGGDVFDLLVGDKTFFREQFAAEIKAISAVADRGAEVRYLEGNHDFHLSGIFAEKKKLIVEKEDFSLIWQGRRVHVAHGDLLNPKDYGYRLLRFVTRTWFCRLLIFLMPGSWIAGIGNWSSGKSRKYSEQNRENETRWHSTRELFRSYAKAKAGEGEQLILIGHSHIIDFQEYAGPSGPAKYCNLGFLPEAVPYLVWQGPDSLPKPGIWHK